jgi:TetR/AcrR family transcriptional regulator, transcriptional repressor for nem operon
MSDRRTKILEAATGLICRNGFQQTSVDDVIREAGLCGKAHFYHYFKSKEELGYEVLDRQVDRFTERGLALLREPMIDPIERLHLFIDTLVAGQVERGFKGGSPFGPLAAEMADAHEGFRMRLAAAFERWTMQVRALLSEAQPRLAEGADAERLSRFVIATLEGALLMARVTREVGALHGIAADLKRFVGMHLRDGS